MKQKVLIVEDSMTIRRMLIQAIAQQTGLEIDAFDTLEGARHCQGDEYVVALVDLTLPDAPSGEAVKVLLERGLPVVILTADISEDKREAWLEAGVLDYVMKDSRHSLQYAVGLVHRLYLNQQIEVLVVDDSRTSRHRTMAQLRKQLLLVHEASHAREALTTLEQNPAIRLVLVDYYMPEIDGISLVRMLRERYSKQQLAIIGISVSDKRGLSARYLKQGANDFLNQPFEPEELQCRVSHNLEALEQFNSIQESANRDYLTGLYNRRYWFNEGQKWFEEHQRQQTPLALCVLDVDHFKQVNDHWGHAIGDQLLCHLTRLLTQFFPDAMIARFGGEEFALMVPHCTVPVLLKRLEGLRQQLRQQPLSRETPLFVRASFGVINVGRVSMDEALSEADRLLYQAKNTGRDKIVSQGPST
ncbi:diguanylate cyclase [Aeromonas salmonicida]|uniref:diguanylate cyclase n=1 Tax=Aeromonas salmonicida TaxID=645 RepID=UPI00259FC66D|nr:diguanylate cyclase [Aeromonas salmonicida]MDM5150097.1 diguanylate cyclase [Aeromonas salmonicida]